MNVLNRIPSIQEINFRGRIEVKSEGFKELPVKADRNDTVLLFRDTGRVVLVSNFPFHEMNTLKNNTLWGLFKLCGFESRDDNKKLYDNIKALVRDAFFDEKSVRNLDETF